MEKQDILLLIDEKSYPQVKRELTEMNIADIAEILAELDHANLTIIFRLLPKDMAADVFAHLEHDVQEALIGTLSDAEIAHIVNDLFLDDAVDFIEELPANVVARVLRNTSEPTRKAINHLLQYGDDTAGSIMTIEFVDLKATLTVEEALDVVRNKAVDKETVYTCYVKDEQRKLLGYVTLKQLLLVKKPDTYIAEIMQTNLVFAETGEDKESVADKFRKYGLTAMPVVDSEHRIVGIVTVDDAIGVLEEEVTEDFHRMAALTPSERPYLKTGVFRLAGNRIIWLLVLMFASMLTGAIIERYETALAVLPVLTGFIPMLMDAGGNSGSQASTMVTRGMALGEIKPKDCGRVMLKEFRVAMWVIPLLAVFVFLRVILLTSPEKLTVDGYTESVYMLGLAVSCALAATILIAKLLGGLLPILAKLVRIDPALMSSPLLSTILDTCSLSIYFGFVTMFLTVI